MWIYTNFYLTFKHSWKINYNLNIINKDYSSKIIKYFEVWFFIINQWNFYEIFDAFVLKNKLKLISELIWKFCLSRWFVKCKKGIMILREGGLTMQCRSISPAVLIYLLAVFGSSLRFPSWEYSTILFVSDRTQK